MNSVVSVGSSGFRLCSWATRRFRNPVVSADLLLVAALGENALMDKLIELTLMTNLGRAPAAPFWRADFSLRILFWGLARRFNIETTGERKSR